MSHWKSVSVVIPVYQERENLRQLMEELDAVSRRLPGPVWEFVSVDDGSTDGSADVLKELARKDSRVRVFVFSRNFGQTAAMSCGISQAKGDVILPLEAVLQIDPADLPAFLAKLSGGYACVSGWRKGRMDAAMTRRLPSWLANGLISWLTGTKLHDYGCSMKAYRREAIRDIPLYGEMHRFIPAYVAWSGGRVGEIAVNHRPRRHGESKYGLSRIFKVVLDLLVIKFLFKYFNRPMHFFGLAGLVSLAIGFLCEAVAVWYKLTGEKSFVATPLPTIGAMFLIVGVQFVLFGLMAEVLMRTYYESQNKRPYAIREQF